MHRFETQKKRNKYSARRVYLVRYILRLGRQVHVASVSAISFVSVKFSQRVKDNNEYGR